MSKTTKTVEDIDEAEMLLYFHQQAMSDNAIIAATGRLMKEISPAVCRWLEEERRRNATKDDQVQSIKAFLHGIQATLCVGLETFVGTENLPRLVPVVLPILRDGMLNPPPQRDRARQASGGG